MNLANFLLQSKDQSIVSAYHAAMDALGFAARLAKHEQGQKTLLPLLKSSSFEVSHTALEDAKVLLSEDVDCYPVAAALCVSHLAEASAIG